MSVSKIESMRDWPDLTTAYRSLVLDIDDELVAGLFTETELHEIEFTPIPKVPELSDKVDNFHCKFTEKTNLNEIRQLIKEEASVTIMIVTWTIYAWLYMRWLEKLKVAKSRIQI